MLQWQKEYGRANELPSVLATLLLFAVLTLVLVAAHGLVEAGPVGAEQRQERSLCEEHTGRPGWAAVCE